MKLVTATVAAFLLMAGMAVAQESMATKTETHAGSANVEQSLKNMENEWVKASLASNPDALGPMLSDDFINIDSDGKALNKSETMERMKKTKWETSEISDLQVNQHGDSAVVTGTWRGKGTDSTGKAVDATERWADTWVMKDGKWQCVASASAPIT
jgi:ketosteroid isomerase-like protein